MEAVEISPESGEPQDLTSKTSEEMKLDGNLEIKKSLLHKLKEVFSRTRISVEPILFLHNVASNMAWVASQDLMEQKACRINLGYSSNVCDNLNEFDEQQIAVQNMVSSFLMWRSILEASIKLVAVPLLGWWADRRGRNFPLILSLFCLGCEAFSHLVNALCSSWPLEAMLTGSLFYGISGGTHALLMLAFSIMADRTTNRRRTLRMGILDGFYYLGSPVGLAIGPPIFKSIGYAGVFSACVLIYGVAIVYVLAAVTEKSPNQQESEASASDCCGLDKLSDAFYSTVKPRPCRARRYIIILVLAMLLDSFVIWGESNVKYLFTQRALDWNYDQYSHYGTASTFLSVIGALVVVPLLTMASLQDTLIGLLGALSRTFERVVYIFANSPNRSWLMYLGAVIGTGSPLAPIAIRSQISKLALDDVGQIYSVMAVGESLLPFVSAPTYKSIYTATVDGFVGAYYVLSAGINSMMAACFVYVYISMRRQQQNIRMPFT